MRGDLYMEGDGRGWKGTGKSSSCFKPVTKRRAPFLPTLLRCKNTRLTLENMQKRPTPNKQESKQQQQTTRIRTNLNIVDFRTISHPLAAPSPPRTSPDQIKKIHQIAMKKNSYPNVCLWPKPSKTCLESRWSASWFEISLITKAGGNLKP